MRHVVCGFANRSNQRPRTSGERIETAPRPSADLHDDDRARPMLAPRAEPARRGLHAAGGVGAAEVTVPVLARLIGRVDLEAARGRERRSRAEQRADGAPHLVVVVTRRCRISSGCDSRSLKRNPAAAARRRAPARRRARRAARARA